MVLGFSPMALTFSLSSCTISAFSTLPNSETCATPSTAFNVFVTNSVYFFNSCSVKLSSAVTAKKCRNRSVIVQNNRLDRPHGQFHRSVSDFFTHIIPILVYFMGGDGFFQFYFYLRITLLGNALRIIDIGNFCKACSMTSVTYNSTLWASASGYNVTTKASLILNSGSSSLPSRT